MDTKTPVINTVLTNQAGFLEQCLSQWQRALDNEDSISLFLIDVDKFDDIRRKAGCMRKIISAMDDVLNRDTDFISQFSREKIMFVTSSMTYPQSRQLAERIHHVLAALGLRQIEGDESSAHVTVSVGHITYSPVKNGSYGILDIISNVIKLCRQAKEGGGNSSKTRLHSQLLS